VFLDGELEHSATWAHALGAWERLGALAHAVDTADLLVGLAQLVAEADRTDTSAVIRRLVGDMVIYATMLRAGLDAALDHAEQTPEGHATPNELYTNATKFFAAEQYGRVVRDLHEVAGRELVSAPSVAELEQTGFAVDEELSERIRLLNAIRDLTADTYGGWRAVTLLVGGGGLHAQRMVASKHYDLERARALARRAAGL
jgi:4-hydroxybutyryl-CoA dehydratase/vinylacetyl-CoA-Delta-isomerase